MKPLTKRLIELFILLVVIITVTLRWNDRAAAKHGEEVSQTVSRAVNQAIWDKHGPGTKNEYLSIFRHDSSDSFYDTWEKLAAVDKLSGKPAPYDAPQEKQGLRKEFAVFDSTIAKIDALVERGPYIAAPDEAEFNEPYDRTSLNFFKMREYSGALRLYALQDWLDGKPEAAIGKLKRITKLADALRYSPQLIDHLIRAGMYRIALDGYGEIAWLNPSAQENQQALEAIDDLLKADWTLPSYVEIQAPFIASIYSTGVTSIFAVAPDVPAVAYLCLEPIAPENDQTPEQKEFIKQLREAGIIPQEPLTQRELVSFLGDWTTVPAMRKRVKRTPKEVFQNDPLLDPKTAEEMPRLVYLAARYGNQQPTITSAAKRIARVEVRCHMARAIYWARVWRDQHGRWPTVEEFAAESSIPGNIKWHVSTDQAVFMREFYKRHMSEPDVLSARVQKVKYPTGPVCIFSIDHLFNNYVTNKANASSEELLQWYENSFEVLKPLVERTERKMNLPDPLVDSETELFDGGDSWLYASPSAMGDTSGLAVWLNLPKRFFWVTEAGPDGVDDGLEFDFDPETDRGDIIRLAGWE